MEASKHKNQKLAELNAVSRALSEIYRGVFLQLSLECSCSGRKEIRS